MNNENYVFAQLVQFLNDDIFRHLANKYQADRYVKFFTCWNQLLTIMFRQLSNRESLWDLIVALDANQGKYYHLGVSRNLDMFSRHKGGVKVHTPLDLETQVPTFIHITTASVHDMNAMDEAPYEPGSFYVFERSYNDFRQL